MEKLIHENWNWNPVGFKTCVPIVCFIRTADEEDELLYGDSDTTVFQGSLNTSQTSESER